MVRGKIVAHHVAGVEAKVVNTMCDLQSEREYVDEAVKWYRKAAEQGNDKATNKLINKWKDALKSL